MLELDRYLLHFRENTVVEITPSVGRIGNSEGDFLLGGAKSFIK